MIRGPARQDDHPDCPAAPPTRLMSSRRVRHPRKPQDAGATMAGGIVVPTFHPPSSRFRAWLLQRLARQWFAKQVSHPGITSLSHSVRRRSLASYPRLASARVRRRSVPEFLSSTAICRSARSIGTLPKYVHVQYALAEEVSNMPRLTVAQPEAVEALMAKVQARAQGHPSWYRL